MEPILSENDTRVDGLKHVFSLSFLHSLHSFVLRLLRPATNYGKEFIHSHFVLGEVEGVKTMSQRLVAGMDWS